MGSVTTPDRVGTGPSDAGTVGNERLTAWAGAALLAGFAAEGLTLLDVGWYIDWHILIGLALFAPLAVKLAATGYRFLRYYSGEARYVRKGPPRMLLRVLAPLLIACTGVVLLTGVALLVTFRWHRQLEELHLLSTWAWLALALAHLAAYLLPSLRAMSADLRERSARSWQRIGTVLASGVLGLALGVVLPPLLDR